MNGDILVLNSGSSGIKFDLYDGADPALALLAHGRIEAIGAAVRLRARDRNGELLADGRLGDGLDHGQTMAALVTWVRQREAARDIAAVGHRMVHGGTRFQPVPVDAAVLAELERLDPLAPYRCAQIVSPHAPGVPPAVTRRTRHPIRVSARHRAGPGVDPVR